MVTGIGEELCEVESMPSVPLVVACMGEGVSTPWAYGKLDEAHQNFANAPQHDERPEQILRAMRDGRMSDACDVFYNIFEEVVPTVQPHVERLKQTMRDGGAIRAMMSGSGPSVFGVFHTVEEASAVVDRLKKMGGEAFVCHAKGKY